MKLVIVESPAKAKTIGKILGKEYVVESSIGHIRDLPKAATEIPAKYKGEKWTRLGVNVENDFEPLYIVPSDKKKQIKKLKDLLAKADELYLATDEDREGESISWHLLEVLKPKKGVSVKRLAFHEITKEAILKALDNPREIDMDLVSAQETRRILDRLYGYEISPILWRKVAPKLSAGRVQSVALRLIVERERSRIKFKPAEYKSATGMFETAEKKKLEAVLKIYDKNKIAVGKNFNLETGELEGKNVLHLNSENIEEIKAKLEKMDYVVDSVEEKPVQANPYAPFVTSTLQQDANYKLGFSSKQTMQVAQKLYENGYITYMRTDSISLSSEAISAARNLIEKEYGSRYLPAKPRVFKSKVKNAQEAHEAIRPAGHSFKTPASVKAKLTVDEFKLYDLIFKRTLASQMSNAIYQQTVIKIVSKCGVAEFQANGKVVEFDGFTKVYSDNFSGKSDTAEAGDNKDVLLPAVKVGESVDLKELVTKDHSTKAPARFTEASLVKELEAQGVGRPSTYASIIDTILRRNYVFRLGKALVPTFMAFAVIRLLEQHFMNLVDLKFTALMEEDLDAISRGEEESLGYLKHFYFGGSKEHDGLVEMIKADIDAREICTLPLEEATDIFIRVGKFGPYLERGEERASIPEGLEPDKLKVEMAEELLKNNVQMAEQEALGVHPETGEPVYAKVGRFGPYVQLGEPDKEKKIKPKMKSLLKSMNVEEIDLETALKLLAMPKELGVFEDNNEKIMVDIGRYGPYVKAGSETRSLTEDVVLDLDLEGAVAVLRTPKPAGRGRRKQAAPLKEFEDGKIKVLTGRYGPYVTDGKTNASLPKGTEAEDVTVEMAKKLLEDKKK